MIVAAASRSIDSTNIVRATASGWYESSSGGNIAG